MERTIRNPLLQNLYVRSWKESLRHAAHAVMVIGVVLATGCSGGGSSSDKPPDDLVTGPNDTQTIITPTPQPTPTPTPQPTPTPLSVKILPVNAEVVSKNVISNASHLMPQIAFTNQGAGIAAWSVHTGSGYRALYSVYDAVAKTWSAEETLVVSDRIDPHPRVISNGRTLLLVWSQELELYARVYTPNVPQPWNTARRLNDDQPSSWAYSNDVGIATDGQTYLVNWHGDAIYARMFSGNDWSPRPELIGLSNDASGFIRSLGYTDNYVMGGASGYISAWIDSGDGKSVPRSSLRIRANVYRNDTQTWSGPLPIAIEDGNLRNLEMASNDIGHALSWTFHPAGSTSPWPEQIRVSVFDMRTTPTQWSTPVTLTTTNENPPSTPGPKTSLAAKKSEFAAVWITKNDTSAAVELLASHYSVDATGTAAWRTASPLASAQYSFGSAEIIGSDNGFACAWVNNTGVIRAIYSAGAWSVDTPLPLPSAQYQGASWYKLAARANEYALAYSVSGYTSGVFQEQSFATETSGSRWSTPVAVLPLRHGNMWRIPLTIATSPSGFWYTAPQSAANAADHLSNVVIRRPGAAPNTTEKLAVNQYRGSADTPVLASNSSGDLLVVWPHYDDGHTVLYGAIRQTGTWSTATRLDLADPGVDNNSISKASIRVASNGTTFAVLWGDQWGVNLRTFDGRQWDPSPRRANDNNIHLGDYNAALTAYKTGYALTWIQTASSPFGDIRSVALATMLNGVWQKSVADSVIAHNTYGPAFTEIAAGKNNSLLVAWNTSDTPNSASLMTKTWNDGTWANTIPIPTPIPTPISTTNPMLINLLKLQVTTSGSFALYWRINNGQMYSAVLPLGATTWTPPQQLAERSVEFASIGGESEHSAAWFASNALVAAQTQSNQWQFLTAVKQKWQAGTDYYDDFIQPRMVAAGGSILYAWNGTSSYSGNYVNHALGLGKLVNGTWTEAFAIGGFGTDSIQRHGPSLARFGDSAAMAWVQYDRSVDASVADIVVQPALF